MSPDRYCSTCNTTHNPDEACPVTPTKLINAMRGDFDPAILREPGPYSRSPFNSPRDPAQPPYHLRNGIADRAEADRNEAEHRRRLGMSISNKDSDRERFDAWVKTQFDGTVDDDCIETMWLAWQAAQR